MGLDHGILNVPLRKRGDIDAQIDRYKAGLAAEKKAADRAFKVEREALRAEPKAAAAALTEEWYAWHANRLGLTKAKLRSHVKSECHWNSRKALEMIRNANAMYRGQF